MQITFKTPHDVRDLVFSLEKLNYLTIDRSNPAKPRIEADASELAQEFLIDDQGNTYFLPAILSLSRQAAKRSTLRFKTRNGESLSLFQIWNALDYQSLQLIYNQPLIETLITINLNPNQVLNPKITQCTLGKNHFPLISPAITHKNKTYDFHRIHSWLQRSKTNDIDLVDPVFHYPLDKKDILENKALTELINVNLAQLIAIRNRFRKIIAGRT